MISAPPKSVAQSTPLNGAPKKSVRRWQELAVEWLPGPLGRFLDYGCGPCGLLEKLCKQATECHGVDVDADKIEAASSRFPQFQLSTIDFTGRAPYPNEHFDTIAAVEVIEHVPDERRMLAELSRLLKPGGRLVLTTPHRGWLTFLDPGNFKFLFPRTHRFIHLHLRRSPDYYHHRFERSTAKGLAGDISVGHRPPWHRHYRPEEILAFCPSDLEQVGTGVYFPAMRAVLGVRLALNVLSGGRITDKSWPFWQVEARLSQVQSRGGDQLVMLFRKRS